MSNWIQFFSPTLVPTAIVNIFSAGGAVPVAISTTGSAKEILSGSLTANTYSAALVDITGKGIVDFAAAIRKDSTSRTIGIKVVIDEVVVFGAVDQANTSANYGIIAIGGVLSGTTILEPLPFTTSLRMYVKSSVSENNKVSLLCQYQVY